MKLSSKSGLVKSNTVEIKSALFDEFNEPENIVRINERFIDLVDDQYSIPKLNQSNKENREVNRFDGNRIFVGKEINNDIVLDEKKPILNPVVFKSNASVKSKFSAWQIGDFDSVDDDFQNEDQYSYGMKKEGPSHQDNDDEFNLPHAKLLSKEIVENAKKEAEAIKQKAEMEAEELRNQAYKEGHADGFAQVNTEIETLRTIQKSLQSLNDEIIKSSETKIIELVKLITEKLFANGMALDATILRDVVARAINESSRLGNIKVYLNPTDLEKLKKLWRESELDYNGQKIQLASNTDVIPGGCFIEGDYGSVDARVNTQVEAIVNTLEEIQLDQVEE